MTGGLWDLDPNESIKRCRKCRQVKPISEFYEWRNSVHHNCLECAKDYAREYHYGISAAEYRDLVAVQDGRCAICGKVPNKPMVDHDHNTGAVRGLLCHKCNSAIGLLGDDPDLCDRAAEYLRSQHAIDPRHGYRSTGRRRRNKSGVLPPELF